MDEFTKGGLLRQLLSSLGYKATVGKRKCPSSEQILGAKEKSRLDVKRLITLYDGATCSNLSIR